MCFKSIHLSRYLHPYETYRSVVREPDRGLVASTRQEIRCGREGRISTLSANSRGLHPTIAVSQIPKRDAWESHDRCLRGVSLGPSGLHSGELH